MTSVLQRLRSYWIPLSVVGLVLLVGALTSMVFVYGIFHHQWDGRASRFFATISSVPAARVGRASILYKDYLFQLDADRRFLASPTARLQGLPTVLTAQIRSQALDRMMRAAAVEDLAAEQKIVVTQLDVDRAYDGLVAQASSSSVSEIRSALKDQFGWSEADFKQLVMRPALLEDVLRQKLSQGKQASDPMEQAITERLARKDVKKYLIFAEE